MTKAEIKEKLLSNEAILNRYSVKAIALFGSFARNEQGKDSDIDFLIEFREPTFDNYMGLSNEMKKLFRRKVDLVNIKALKKRIKPYILRDAEWLKKA